MKVFDIKVNGVPFRQWQVCHDCPSHEDSTGIALSGERHFCQNVDHWGLTRIEWNLQRVPQNCPRFMEQVVFNQKKP